MSPLKLLTIPAALLAFAPGPALAQFQSSSDGSDGPLNVTANLQYVLPPDGVINATTVTISPQATLTFVRNALNTPVYLLATGDVVIEGTIDLSGGAGGSMRGGAGGPGGFDGGAPRVGATPAGEGFGPGGGPVLTSGGCAGLGGYGAFTGALTRTDIGAPYGTQLLVPLIGGSGGAGGDSGTPRGGGGGGGAILISSSTRIVLNGAVVSLGAQGNLSCGRGSGGAVRLLSNVVQGSGYVDVRGGGSSGVAGRIRVDTLEPTALQGVVLYGDQTAITVSSYMQEAPADLPALAIVEAAGQSVAPGMPFSVLLPAGAPAMQDVRVDASDFRGSTTVEVRLTPHSGAVSTYTQTFMGRGPQTTDSLTFTVDVPPNVVSAIQAFVR